MKIRLIVPLGGAVTYQALEKDNGGEWIYYDFDKLEAVNLVNANMAIPKVKKEFETALKEIETLKDEKNAKAKLSKDIENLEVLKETRVRLEKELSEVADSIETVEAALK